MCGRLAPARTERKTISLICWLLNQNASLAPLFVKKAFYGAADVNSITNPDVTCHIDLKGLHEARGIYKYKLGVIGLIDSGRHSIPSQRFLSLIFEDFYKLGIHKSHHVASRWQSSETRGERSKQAPSGVSWNRAMDAPGMTSPRARSWRVPNHTWSSGTPSPSSSSAQKFPLSRWWGLLVLARESGKNCGKLDQNHKRVKCRVSNTFRSF